jgi:hypothetical protein
MCIMAQTCSQPCKGLPSMDRGTVSSPYQQPARHHTSMPMGALHTRQPQLPSPSHLTEGIKCEVQAVRAGGQGADQPSFHEIVPVAHSARPCNSIKVVEDPLAHDPW